MQNMKEFYNSIFFGIIFGIIFGLIDALFFVLFEKELTIYLKGSIHNQIIINLFEGSLSACISLFIANFIEKSILRKNIIIMKHPLLDSVGILTGAFIVGFLYIIYNKYKNSKKKNNEENIFNGKD
jgi:hypothetical protein